MKKLVLLTAVAAFSMAGAAVAQENGTAQRMPAAASDAAGKDGMMMKRQGEKMKRYTKHKRKSRFEYLDANSDGAVSKDEFMSNAAKRFEKLDMNHDGKITKEEIEKRKEMRKEKMKERMEKRKEKRQGMKQNSGAQKSGEMQK